MKNNLLFKSTVSEKISRDVLMSSSIFGIGVFESSNNDVAEGILNRSWCSRNSSSSTWHDVWSIVGTVMCFELDGKYVSLYSSIWSNFFNSDATGAKEKFKYRWSMVSMGLLGNKLGGKRYNSDPLYFLFDVDVLLYRWTRYELPSKTSFIWNGPLAWYDNFITSPVDDLD